MLKTKKNHRWNTKEYEKRTKELYRTDLHKLYPSEAWALYRIIPKCKTVLDIGCGNGAMSEITKLISAECKYYGVDHQEKLINEANKIFPHSIFEYSDLISYLSKNKKQFDCVMSWSVIKSFENWREIISFMLEKSKKYVICDIRVANTKKEMFDKNVCWANYGGKKGPIVVVNYKTFKNFLLSQKKKLKKIEIAAYQSEWGDFVNFKKNFNPSTFLVTCVLHKKNQKGNEFEIFERLPKNIEIE